MYEYLDANILKEKWYSVKNMNIAVNLFNPFISDQATSQGQGQERYSRTAKLLTTVVLAYMIQWLPSLVCCIWDLVVYSPIQAKLSVVFVGSLGGVFNGIAYTAIRIKMNAAKKKDNQRKSPDVTPNDGKMNSDSGSSKNRTAQTA